MTRRDTLLWPIDRDLVLGLAPAGLAAAGVLLAAWLLDGAAPDLREQIALITLIAQGLVWLLFAPIYLFGWVHNHPRRDREATGQLGSLVLAGLMWIVNVLVFGGLLLAFGRL